MAVNTRECLNAMSIAEFRLDHCLPNKYTNWYFDIILNALLRDSKKSEEYVESHHVVPKSISGDKASTGHRVNLTAREHYICHLLLPKMLINENKFKMARALHLLVHAKNDKRYKTSRIYEMIKRENSIAMSYSSKAYWSTIDAKDRSKMRSGYRNSRYGKEVSKETRNKISEANTGRFSKDKHPLWGVGHTMETKKKMSEDRQCYNDGKRWYHNPKTLVEYFVVDKPDETILGRSPNHIAKCKGFLGSATGKRWYTNRSTKDTKYFVQGEQPDGYTLGRK